MAIASREQQVRQGEAAASPDRGSPDRGSPDRGSPDMGSRGGPAVERPAEAQRPDLADVYPPIGDYAPIGDCGSVALVSRDGSIDWLCWPRFDSPALFARLLDRRRGGFFEVRPLGRYEVERRYLQGTNVLETTFHTPTGVARLVDAMLVGAEDGALRPEHELLRCLEGVEGEVRLWVDCDVQGHYGRHDASLVRRGACGAFWTMGADVLVFRGDVPLEHGQRSGRLAGAVRLRAGERRHVALCYDREEPAVLPLLGAEADRALQASVDYWRRWSGGCTYEGPYRDAVLRSALALKLMVYAPSGAIIAAPTASLPERLGGQRNWDYRYCWVRDAAFTVRALFALGFVTEGEAFFSWLTHASRRSLPRLDVVYDVHGSADLPERELEHLEGYAGSRPVRIGNAASHQLQLDVYGILVAAAHEYVRAGGQLSSFQRVMLRRIGKYLARDWRLPDNGIWEVRGQRRRHTFSTAMCWVALDRLIDLHRAGVLPRVPVERYREVRNEIRREIEREGFDGESCSYTSTFQGPEVDASLLLLGIYGYADPTGARMEGTRRRIRQELGEGPLLRRYGEDWSDGVGGPEGAFGACSFWEVEHLALAGRLDEARRQFEALLEYANDLGLYGEEVDPFTGEALGNFPQGLTHLALIDAAVRISEVEGCL